MTPASIFRVACSAINDHRARSAFGAVGMALAVAVTLTSLGVNEGARRAAQAEVDRLGIDTIVVKGQSRSVNIQDADELRRRLPAVRAISEVLELRASASAERGMRTVAVTGVTGSYDSIRPLDAAAGRLINTADESSGARVCVIGEQLAFELIGPSPVGASIRIGHDWYKIVGTLASESPDAEALFVPASALLPQPISVNPSQAVTAVWLRAQPEQVRETAAVIRDVLSSRPGSAKYDVIVARDLLNARSRTQTMFVRLSLAAGGLLFLLGGAAIANALLSSVLERIPEIGVRRAVGAKRRHIAAQFLLEAALIAAAGAGAGMASALLLIAAAFQGGWDVAIPVATIPAVPAVAAVVALIAGTYPALRAATINPIDALSRG